LKEAIVKDRIGRLTYRGFDGSVTLDGSGSNDLDDEIALFDCVEDAGSISRE